LPVPTTKLIEPPRPPDAVPVVSAMLPLLPAFDVPVLNNSAPDTPLDTMFADHTLMAPEPADALVPLTTVTAPPAAAPDVEPPYSSTDPPAAVVDVVLPPLNSTLPPTPEVPDPAATLMDPPRPP